MKRVATTTLLRSFLSRKSSNSFSLIHRHHHYHLSTFAGNNNDQDDKDWNDAWETAWLPDDNITSAPWDSDLNLDSDTKAFVEDMNHNWHHRRNNNYTSPNSNLQDSGFSSFENDYRLKKQRIHAGLWTKQIHLLQESKLGGGGDDIDNLLHSCSEIFESAANDPKVPTSSSSSEFKNKPDGWETTSKSEDANVWEMSQREEDVLLQEFERRLAFCKFQEGAIKTNQTVEAIVKRCTSFHFRILVNQSEVLVKSRVGLFEGEASLLTPTFKRYLLFAMHIASFIKTHIFSRRRPIDGWKYMIEVIGPNARKGKGSVSRIPGLADPATQPFTEERTPVSGGRLTSRKAK